MKKIILVIGGAGYIVSACVAELHRPGHEVVVFDNLSTGQAQALPKDVPVTLGDITDKEALRQLCQQYSFSAVVHSVAKKAVGIAMPNVFTGLSTVLYPAKALKLSQSNVFCYKRGFILLR